ncbi:MAG: thymidine phosphorylase [Gemmatimonadaceae bacterium]|nr:thymidine phosphorylase [Gemmatimonadaceae bacterium]
MHVPALIARKRDGGRLSATEWRALMRAYAADEVPDYQLAAMAMAVLFRGMDAEETEALMVAMLESGGRLALDHLAIPRVDKHSTGGVGDKVSLILAPLVAACGVAVPMMSGRGLGHTGGTLDKLESIPGFRTRLTLAEATTQIERIGCALIGQTAEIAPADRKLYALRDATATVEAIPLIAASIMSKKLAEGLTGLVLDVKTGSGAFMPDEARALELAARMIALGEARGVRTVALLTAMDQPLGRMVGNALEVVEAVDALHGRWPTDLREVTVALAVEMLVVGGVAPRASAGAAVERALASGAALERFREIVIAQGGDPRVCDAPTEVLPSAPVRHEVRATRGGVVQAIPPRAIGQLVIELGGGRRTVADVIDPAVGVEFAVRVGDRVEVGDRLATLHASASGIATEQGNALIAAIAIGDAPAAGAPLISHRVTAAGVERL